ncbi:MAG: ATP-binding protein [Bdellovibrionales bacterium]|nr:ATP-binding protein [Bdellovibrionales bacterium]
MIKRDIQKELHALLKEYPVVAILGPRQAGKTTLAKTLAAYQYCNLEDPENRLLASDDPKAFFSQFKKSVILDEIQRVPLLLSYIQTIVDQKNKNGQFVLTGSHQLDLTEAMVQSLAGRVGILNLLPFSINELRKVGIEYKNFQDYVHKGFLPRIYDQKQRPLQAYSNYYRTYVERDVRQIINLKEQSIFESFMKLLAGRVGQVISYSSLAKDVGVDAKTVRNWLSLLEASFLVYKLSPYFENFGKRYIKSPKYYFTEVGLLSFLLGIQATHQLTRDPLVGHIFENLVVMECVKTQINQGHQPNMYFFKDSNGNEIDLILKKGRKLKCFEIKASSTYHSSFSKNLNKIKQINTNIKKVGLIYNGQSRKLSNNIELIHFKKAANQI